MPVFFSYFGRWAKPTLSDFPYNSYEFIPESIHEDRWDSDLAEPELDRFFICSERNGSIGGWLGSSGAAINNEILSFINDVEECSLYGFNPSRMRSSLLGRNMGTFDYPIAHGRRYTGLHIETVRPEQFIQICRQSSADSKVN
jgi:hypothetical protein